MCQCEGADSSYATPSVISLCRHCHVCCHVRKDGECGNKRRVCVVDFVKSSILVPKMNDTEQMFVKGSTFAIGENERAKFPEEMRDNNSDRGGRDEAPFDIEIAGILSPFACVMFGSIVSSLLTGHYAV